jgi:hypothetical protein
MTIGQVTDYAVKRFTEHCADAESDRGIAAWCRGPGCCQVARGETLAAGPCVPRILPAVRAAMEGSRAVVV